MGYGSILGSNSVNLCDFGEFLRKLGEKWVFGPILGTNSGCLGDFERKWAFDSIFREFGAIFENF